MRQVQTDEAKEFCKQHKLFFIETSALADSNVNTAFETILREIYRLISRKSVTADGAVDGGGGGSGGGGFGGAALHGQSIVLTDDTNKVDAHDANASKLRCKCNQ